MINWKNMDTLAAYAELKAVKPVNLGTRTSFADIAATVTELLGVEYETSGVSFAGEIL